MSPGRLRRLPTLLDRKIYKTGQTRGADDDEIYQNRVSRSSTVLIPYGVWKQHFAREGADKLFERGYIVLISPEEFFNGLQDADQLKDQGLVLGRNALIFYETRAQWSEHAPKALRWRAAKNRQRPLGGKYVARIPATTAVDEGAKVVHGFDSTAQKGAGIRVYEYASSETILQCRLQLEALFWLCGDSLEVVVGKGMTRSDAKEREGAILEKCNDARLLDLDQLKQRRILNEDGRSACPLCLEGISGASFFSRVAQAEGREVHNLTITQISLFHVEELRMGVFNHRPYNLGWGHHHCNVVAKDAGIEQTLEWMRGVLVRNGDRLNIPVAE